MRTTAFVFGIFAATIATLGAGGCDGGEVVGVHASRQPWEDGPGPAEARTPGNTGVARGRAGADTADPRFGESGPRGEGAATTPAPQWRLGTMVTDLAVAGDGRVWVAGPLIGGAEEGGAGAHEPWMMTAGGDGRGTFGVAAWGPERMVVAGIRGADDAPVHGWMASYDLDGAELARWEHAPLSGTSWLMRVRTQGAQVVGVGFGELIVGPGAWDVRRHGLLVRWQPDGGGAAAVGRFGEGHDSAWLSDVAVLGERFVAVGGARTVDEPGDRRGWIVVSEAGGQAWQSVEGLGELTTVQVWGDQGFIAAGEREGAGGGESDVWLVCLDAEGRLLREATVDLDGDDRAVGSALTARGGLLLAGSTRGFGGDEGSRAWVVELDPGVAGLPLVAGRRMSPVGADGSSGFAVVELPSGTLLTGGVAVYGDTDVRGWIAQTGWN